MRKIKTISEFIYESLEANSSELVIKKRIEQAIRETLVVENSQSVKYAVDKIFKIIEEVKKSVDGGSAGDAK